MELRLRAFILTKPGGFFYAMYVFIANEIRI
jgi:hypothetical protein